MSLFKDKDIYLFKQGNHFRLYNHLGSHPLTLNGTRGTFFSVWAPNANTVSVIGDFNNWNPEAHRLTERKDSSGIWEGFITGVEKGSKYKYFIKSKLNDFSIDKSDPYSFYSEISPKSASIVWDLEYEWSDQDWMKKRFKSNDLSSPVSIYEMHLGSWRRVPEENNRFLTYSEIASELVDYIKKMGFTHVEFLPVMEHPFYGSWGYQTTGYFSPTSRYGTPQDFMYLVDCLHQNGIGVILDWVPSHFPSDGHGLAYFDGTHLYEHEDVKKGFHPEWTSYIFNHDRNEVRAFLISSALFWLDKYHVDGIRVDAVASMLYLDYARKDDEWIPNKFGGKENLESIKFIKKLNEVVYNYFPDIQTVAEESTAWPMVSRPTHLGGLGFGMKWNMGWMNDTLKYFSKDPIYRKYYHSQLTFSIMYTFSENFLLPLSHDEVTQGKGSLVGKMPGDERQRYANLRLLFGYMYGHPGKKLLFMGDEFGQCREWNHDESLEWHVLQYPHHRGVQRWVKDLNFFYRNEGAMHEFDFDVNGFEWIDFHDWEYSIISFIRKGKYTKNIIFVICNFTPVEKSSYRVGVPADGLWQEVLNSNAIEYGGDGLGNLGVVQAEPIKTHGKDYTISLTLPPSSVLFFKREI